MLVEDLTIVRETLAEVLDADERYRVVGAFATGKEALEQVDALHPDLILCDLMLPDMLGLEVVRHARKALPSCRLLLLTAHQRADLVAEAEALGAHGIVMKGTPLRTLKEAIAAVLGGALYFCPEAAALLRERRAEPQVAAALSSRERQVVQMVARGLSSKEIAVALGLSEKTVWNHRANLMKKLGVHDVAGLTRYAIAAGLVEGVV